MKKRLKYPRVYKSRKSYLEAKINHFNIALAGLAKVWEGSAYLPKNIREAIDIAKEITYDAACSLVTFEYNQRTNQQSK